MPQSENFMLPDYVDPVHGPFVFDPSKFQTDTSKPMTQHEIVAADIMTKWINRHAAEAAAFINMVDGEDKPCQN